MAAEAGDKTRYVTAYDTHHVTQKESSGYPHLLPKAEVSKVSKVANYVRTLEPLCLNTLYTILCTGFYCLLCLICLPLVLLVFKCIQVLQLSCEMGTRIVSRTNFSNRCVAICFPFWRWADFVNEAIALLSVLLTAIP